MKQKNIIILSIIIILIIFVVLFFLLKQGNVETKKERYPTMVVIETSLGNIEVELFDKNAPISVSNFKKYVEAGLYDGTVFHRVINDFMVQGGGFEENGTPKTTFPKIILESTNITGLSHVKGTLGMARTLDPNSATNQFFINTVDNLFLNYASSENPGYAVFGKVTSGMDVVMKISVVNTTEKYLGYMNWPVDDIFIKKVYIKE